MNCNAIVEVSGELVGTMDVIAAGWSDGVTMAHLRDRPVPAHKPYRARCEECYGSAHKITQPNGEPVCSENVVGYEPCIFT